MSEFRKQYDDWNEQGGYEAYQKEADETPGLIGLNALAMHTRNGFVAHQNYDVEIFAAPKPVEPLILNGHE